MTSCEDFRTFKKFINVEKNYFIVFKEKIKKLFKNFKLKKLWSPHPENLD